MSQYVKKAIPVTAHQWFEGRPWIAGMESQLYSSGPVCMTKNGPVVVFSGDWIMKGDGEFYLCPDEVFQKTYAPAIKVDTNPAIENNFSYHAPKDGQPEKYQRLRDAAKALAYEIDQLCPNSREKSLAMTNLEQAVFWGNASIARNE